MIAVSAAVSIIGWQVHKRVGDALSRFVVKVDGSNRLRGRYARDAGIGRREDLIADLETQQSLALMAAALEAKRGDAVMAGYFYSLAKRTERRLRER
ncbi:hypothetical protein CCP1ISM_190001 [Azospirillaceae bacterium]